MHSGYTPESADGLAESMVSAGERTRPVKDLTACTGVPPERTLRLSG